MQLEKTWRWFGNNDTISLADIKQTGATGIVTALHHIPNGEIWTKEEILKKKNEIENYGLTWSVVESLPVLEEIKYAGKERDQLIENYKISLQNLGECGIDTVCYNFMPVLDWARTELNHKLNDGSTSLYFNWVDFALFDIHILKRENASQEYPKHVVEQAQNRFDSLSKEQRDNLVNNIIIETQKFVDGVLTGDEEQPLELFREILDRYKNIDKEKLRDNYKYFLEQIIPTAEKYGVRMCVHPDDPPFPILGLPRIVSNDKDIEWILNAVDSPNNGLTFCAGSLSAGSQNDITQMAKKFASKTHFVHLRSTQRDLEGNFFEANHLEGTVNLFDVTRVFMQEQLRRKKEERSDFRMPMRPDHGHAMLNDKNSKHNPGYSLIGRMRGLSEISGVMYALEKIEN